MMKKLKVGMVGMGFIADWHYHGFKANPDAEIAGMTHVFFGSGQDQEREKEVLRKKCDTFGIKVYDSFDVMVADPEIDALITEFNDRVGLIKSL